MTGSNELSPDAEEVLDALAAVVEDECLMEKLVVYAAGLLRGYANMGLAVQTGLVAARGLVNDAISDTAKATLGDSGKGTRSWDPRVVPVMFHLKRTIGNRVRVLKKRAEKFEGRLPRTEEGEPVDRPDATDIEADVAAADLADKRFEALMALAEERGYEDAYYILVAFKDGVRGTTNLMVASGMSSPGQVYRAEAKIRKLMSQLLPELRGDDEPGE